jgi:hypothetical protein
MKGDHGMPAIVGRRSFVLGMVAESAMFVSACTAGTASVTGERHLDTSNLGSYNDSALGPNACLDGGTHDLAGGGTQILAGHPAVGGMYDGLRVPPHTARRSARFASFSGRTGGFGQ